MSSYSDRLASWHRYHTQFCNAPNNNRLRPDDFVTRGQMAAFLDERHEEAELATGWWD